MAGEAVMAGVVERFLTGVLKNPIATVKWLLHRRDASAQRTGAAEGTGARFKFAGKSPANLGGESANKSGDKQQIGGAFLDTSISLCNTCNVDISIIRNGAGFDEPRVAHHRSRDSI
jgi:hypothetical protein